MLFNLKGFVMITRKLLAVCLLFFLSIPSSYALKCQKQSTSTVNDSTTIATTIAIMNSRPAGTILWRQPTQNINLECWVDILSGDENVYFYINPAKIDLGPDIEIGVTYEGQDYLYSSLSGGKLDTKWTIGGCFSEPCGVGKARRTISYSIFFSKKSPPGANKEGPLSPINNYRAFQLDGKGGVRLGSSYNLTVNGLNNFRYVPCTSTIGISPSTVNFGKISNVNAQIGATITSVPFSINEQRDCDASYGLNANLEPLNGTLSSTRDTLIPSNNTSVGISLIKADDQTVVKFKQEFALIPTTTSRNNSRRLLARLKWMTVPKLGAFNAGAVLNIYYK
ncbi:MULTISPECIES: fimbrial protein [Pseudomonas]|uniref:fimbrial protein n=1 Tax=Pseudomonas TaxID=286 RepID=UPI0005A9851C|nr:MULTISPECIES: fimbrial protein [Pseudomonas]KAB0532163.1 fimbrial protein [Pseudomonas chlororaphis subsp. aureofaciens]TSD32759.1 fimbrial protein [Pseudomonas sp. ATCC 13985]WDG51125.1 fimbrial protein [Pseudomonas chlororaphis]WDG57384.1 fimbrial protein [Pseudomonas chlororaphis]WDG63597.1 fimbrial protein [Pseudomonas chlororaphis]